MSPNIFRSPALTHLITMSFFGLFLAGMLVLYPPVVRENFLWRKPVIGSIFGAICILGILAAFSPKQCSRVFDFGREGRSERPNISPFAPHGASSIVRGHHPDCENFSAHVFRIGNRTFCTACTGLFFGGLLALAGTILYFFGGLHVEQSSFLLVWTGVLGVGFGLFQFKVRGFVRLFLNTFFVFGAFLILIGVDDLAHSVIVDIFLVALTLFWLFTRVSLSQWDHRRTCHTCKVAVCEFADARKKVG